MRGEEEEGKEDERDRERGRWETVTQLGDREGIMVLVHVCVFRKQGRSGQLGHQHRDLPEPASHPGYAHRGQSRQPPIDPSLDPG